MVKLWKETNYTVGVPKVYFPKEIQPTEPVRIHQYIVKVKAETRTAAAHKVWGLYGKNWLKQMVPKQTSVRHISLDVNDPESEKGLELSNLGRMPAIRVFSEGIMNKAEKLLDLMKEQSVANLGVIPSPALGVVTRPGKSKKLKIKGIKKRGKYGS